MGIVREIQDIIAAGPPPTDREPLTGKLSAFRDELIRRGLLAPPEYTLPHPVLAGASEEATFAFPSGEVR